MKRKILLATVVGMGLQILTGSRVIAEDQIGDVFMNAFSKSPDSSRNDRRDDYRNDSRHRDGDRYDPRRRDDFRSVSRRDSNDPDIIVRRAYEDILNREPDQEGLRTYRSRIIDDHWSEQDVRSDLRKSDERAGRTPAAAEQVVRRAYQDILGRDPDAAGLAMYRNKLVNEGWNERDVRSDLKKSSERRTSGGISNEQAQQIVRRAYQSVLGRDPDASGSALYAQKIQQSHWSEDDVARELRNSPEYRNKHSKK